MTNPTAPAAALFGEIELSEGVAGHPPQEKLGSNKSANAVQKESFFIVTICNSGNLKGQAQLGRFARMPRDTSRFVGPD